MTLSTSQVKTTLEKVGAIIENSHFVYTSGKHGSRYINKDAIYPHTQVTSLLCWSMAELFREIPLDVVVAPATGGIVLSQWIAHHLTEMFQREVLAVYVEKKDEGFVLRRGYDGLVKGKRVLVAEDILTTGGSVRKTVETVRGHGGDVVGVVALVNRGGVTTDHLGQVPVLKTLLSLPFESWDANDCPLCREKVPIHSGLGKG